MNKVIMMGRLTRDPEVRDTASGSSVGKFSLAVDRRFKRDGQPEADFFNCTAFGKTAEFAGKYLRKGTKVVLDGEIQNDNYTNKDGQKVYGTQIIVNGIEFAESKSTSQNAGGNGQGDATPSAKASDSDFMDIPDDIDEELPFN